MTKLEAELTASIAKVREEKARTASMRRITAYEHTAPHGIVARLECGHTRHLETRAKSHTALCWDCYEATKVGAGTGASQVGEPASPRTESPSAPAPDCRTDSGPAYRNLSVSIVPGNGGDALGFNVSTRRSICRELRLLHAQYPTAREIAVAEVR